MTQYKTALGEDLSKLLPGLLDALQGPPFNTGPGTGTYPLSHAVYDIAKAIVDAQPADPRDPHLAQAVTDAGDLIREGLRDVADAIRSHK